MLGQLAAAHLLTERAPGRFGFHDLLRVYSCERGRCEDSDQERRETAGRALDHYLHTGYRAATVLRPGLEAIDLDQLRPGVAPEPIAAYEQALAWFDGECHVLTAIENLDPWPSSMTWAIHAPTGSAPSSRPRRLRPSESVKTSAKVCA
jgi:hypothetical protein